MIRQVVIGIIGIALIAAAFLGYQKLSESKEQIKPAPVEKITQVFVKEVVNQPEPIIIKTSGNLVAKNRMELYAEVTGLFTSSAHPFKAGVYYAEGENLLTIDQREELIALKAQRSSLYNQLVLLLPDLRFDYPEAVGHWEAYISNFDVNKVLAELPEPISEKEKLFIIGRNVYTAYYNIKNLEQQLSKFVITAPYNGILTEALADPGTLIRSGQKLGEFISPYTYELEVAINTSYSDLLGLGTSVNLYTVDQSKSYNGKVVRINSTVDPGSQTVPIFIQVRGDGLKEGMYLEAGVTAKREEDVYEMDRKLLINNTSVYEVKDSLLSLTVVEPVYFKEKTVLIKGLPDGAKVLDRVVPGAYEGMKVQVISK